MIQKDQFYTPSSELHDARIKVANETKNRNHSLCSLCVLLFRTTTRGRRERFGACGRSSTSNSNDKERTKKEQRIDEHSEQARAPHTNGPRDVPRCGALS